MGCVLVLAGERFDVDRFVAEIRIAVVAVWHKGDVREAGRGHRDDSGCTISVSAEDDLAKQCGDAIAFLHTNNSWLVTLEGRWAVDPYLDFSAPMAPPEIYGRWYSFSRELVRIAGAVGTALVLSTYRIDSGSSRA